MSTARLLVNGKEIRDINQADLDRAKYAFDGSKASGDEDISFGFTSLMEVEKWMGKQSREEQRLYEYLFNLRRMVAKVDTLSAADQEKIRVFQTNKKTARAFDALDTPIKLYQKANYEGTQQFLGTGAYPNLGWYDFNNRTTSYKSSAGCFAMFQFKSFGCRSYIRLSPKNQPRMEWWNNRLSSLLYGSYADIADASLDIAIILLL